MRNYRLHTVSHCDCDQRFRLCLNAFNDTISTLVGIMFFNILEMPCFSLKEEEQCVEWFWWGGCKKFDLVPKAELQKQAFFNNTHPMGLQASTDSSHEPTLVATSPRQTEAPSSFSTVFGGIAKKRRRLLKNKLQGYTIRGYQKFREEDTQKATERESLELPNKTNLIPKVSNVHALRQKHMQKWAEIYSLPHKKTLNQGQEEANKAQQIEAESSLVPKTAKVSKDGVYRDMEEETVKHSKKETERSKRKQRSRRKKKLRHSSPGKTRNLINNPLNKLGEVTPMYRK
ncbi:hypothetical protein XENTR_v10002171 [Xenopus tropicalis]|nr:hypothetical protein XENTR_v10002171 [Xenopus tropicalis]